MSRRSVLASIPQVGFGTWQITSEDASRCVRDALDVGYRHIDTASIYRNEESVGNALHSFMEDTSTSREEIHVTSKASPYEMGEDAVREALNRSLERLRLEYLDLYLIHWPGVAREPVHSHLHREKRLETWRELERALEAGKVREIGVSNFLTHHLEDLLENCSVCPAANQVEMHPWLPQSELLEFCKDCNIVVEAYSSLGSGQLLHDENVLKAAEIAHRTPAQVLLRWGIERDTVVLPRSTNQQRIKENFDILNWSLPLEAHRILSSLEQNIHVCWNPESIQ